MQYKSHNQDEVKKGVPWAPGKNSEVSHKRNANAGGEQIQIKTGTHLTWKQQYRTNSSPNKTGKPEKLLHPKFEPRQTATDQNQPQVDKPAGLIVKSDIKKQIVKLHLQGEAQSGEWRGGKQNLAQKDWGVYFTWT